MKAEKKLIERNLKFNQKYIYLEIVRGNLLDGQFTYCDNCGHLITNMVKVVSKENKQHFTIGTDCAETLSKAKCLYNNGESTDFYLDIYSYNKAAKIATEIRKGKNYIDNTIFVEIETDKGKIIECAKSDLLKFFPELIN